VLDLRWSGVLPTARSQALFLKLPGAVHRDLGAVRICLKSAVSAAVPRSPGARRRLRLVVGPRRHLPVKRGQASRIICFDGESCGLFHDRPRPSEVKGGGSKGRTLFPPRSSRRDASAIERLRKTAHAHFVAAGRLAMASGAGPKEPNVAE
jgi:hypothetical protein